MMKVLAGIFFSLLLTQCLYSQNQAKNWLFGDFGLEFRKESVIIRHDYAPHENRAEGIISDKNGNLLFYTDGFTAWNRNHLPMPNGESLVFKHQNHSVQESLVVPKPGSDSIFYIFTADTWNGQDSSGLYYSVVDLSLDNGMGDVIDKGIWIMENGTNKVSAVFHNNNNDVWVLSKQISSNRYYAFLVTGEGVSETPVISSVGKDESLSFDGQLKASPDGRKIACSYNNSNGEGIDIFDFNSSTGELSNPVSFRLNTLYYGYNGLEFSPDATKLFYTTSDGGLGQFDVTGSTYDEINATRVSVMNPTHNQLLQMQLGPDGKIYITKGGGGGGTEHLGVINYPNEYGTKCHAVENSLYLEGGSSFVARTPNFIQSYLFRTSFGYKNTCQAAPVGFYITNDHMLDSVKWSFGDGSISRARNPEFQYAEAGTYNVQMIAFYADHADTIEKQITINPFSPIDLGNDTTVCLGHTLRLNETFNAYQWSTGDTTRYIKIEKDGRYKVTVQNSYGCYSSDSVYMNVAGLPVIIMPDSVSIVGKDSVMLSPGSFTSYSWNTGETTPSIYVSEGGWYSVEVKNEAGCFASSSVFVADSLNTGNEQGNGWTLLNPLPSLSAGLDMCFINDETGFIVNGKEIIRTTDKGKTWNVITRISSGRRIAFKNATGYVIGNDGTIYKSTHNGDGWNKLKVNFTDDLNAITLISRDTIFITGDSRLFVSNDGGLTWTINEVNGVDIEDSFFTSSKTGHVVCGGGKILKTTDGGSTWHVKLSSGTSPSDFLRVYFVNEKTGFATRAYNYIFKTTDGGETWVEKSSVDAIYSMNFVSDNIGFMVGEYGVINKTTDGGNTWSWCAPNGRTGGYDLYATWFINENEGFATGNMGRILKTADGGKTWNAYSSYAGISQITFTDDNTGYYLSKKIYKTTDAGKTWTPLNTGVVDYDYHYFSYRMGHFFDADTFIVVADDSYLSVVLKTEDGGLTFEKLNINTQFSRASSLFFLDKSKGFFSCYDGAYNNGVFMTIDGGTNWRRISSLTFAQMHFTNENDGFGIRYGDLYSTSDGGVTWKLIYEVYGDLNQMQFVNDSVAYVAGEFNMVLKTTDGGKHWIECRTPYDHLLSVGFINSNVGFVAGEYGYIYKTNDGGLSWKKERLSAIFNSVSLTENRNVYVAGNGGVILKNSVSFGEFSFRMNAVTSFSCDIARLTGIVASNGYQIDNIRFEYGPANTFTNKINATPDKVSPHLSDSISALITGLEAEKEYSCRLVISYNGTDYISDTVSFTTLPEYKIVIDYPHIDGTDVYLSATITANIDTIENIEFEYGVSRNYIHSVKTYQTKVNKGTTEYVGAKLTGLYPGAVYYYRLKARQGTEIIYSEENILKIEGGVIIIPTEVQQVSENSIMLQGLLTAGYRQIQNIWFEYGTSDDPENAVNAYPSFAYGNKTITIEARLENLVPDTKYYFRIKATDGNNTYYSEVFSYVLGESGTETDPLGTKLFPNPVVDFFIVRSTSPVGKIEIFDSVGRLLLVKQDEELIEISTLPRGIYLVRIHTGDKIINKKIYKE